MTYNNPLSKLFHDESRFLTGNTNFEKYFHQKNEGSVGLYWERKQRELITPKNIATTPAT